MHPLAPIFYVNLEEEDNVIEKMQSKLRLGLASSDYIVED